MKFRIYTTVFLLSFACFSFSQVTDSDVLFTVDGEQIMATEFIRVYNKNLDLVKDESQKDIDNYLQLFINYQLKLKDAKRLELDKNEKYKREFLSYKKQLTKNYVSDSKVTDDLVSEAYDRISNEVKATHILIRLDANVKDTLKTYNDLIALRNRALSEGFEKVRTEVHNGKTIFGEELGYFSGFKMVYDFENVAYNTKIGDISMPFRTQFGYHIINVIDKRKSRGEVTVAHIMVSLNQKDSLLDPEVRIKEIYKKMNQGEKFGALAKQFSDDKSSSNKGGKLSPFKGGQLSSAIFEDKAFGLNDIDETSEPFMTKYGWHIIKLLQKNEVQPFEEVKRELENKVKRDSRSKLINTALAKELKTKYSINENKEALPYFESILTADFFKRAWRAPEDMNKAARLFTINNTEFTYLQFANHLQNSERLYFNKPADFKDILKKEYNAFFESSLLKYHEDNLEFTNVEFANILKEYRDGLLLFDLMEKQVWNAAMKDTIGLKNYYNLHKQDYKWKDRVDVVIASAAKKSNVKTVVGYFKNGKSSDEISTLLNSDNEQKIIFTKGIFETDHQSLPTKLELKKGVSKIYNYNDAYHVIDIKEVILSSTKTFEESRGKVVNDYQNQIEDHWIDTLKKRYKVTIDEVVFNKVKNQINN